MATLPIPVPLPPAYTPPPDDYANVPELAAALAAGARLGGIIGNYDDIDTFRIHALKGHSYQLTLTLAGNVGLAPVIDFTDGPNFDRAIAENVDGSGGLFSYTQTLFAYEDFATTFAVGLQAWDVQKAPYGYTLRYTDLGADNAGDTAATAVRVDPVVVTAGRLDNSRDVDAIRLGLTPGLTYRIDLGGVLATDLHPGYGLVLDTAPQSSIPGNKALVVTGKPGEDSILYVRDNYGRVGGYTVTVTQVQDDFLPNAGTSGRLVPGSSVTGQFENGGDSDWFALNLNAGTTYAFQAGKPVHGLQIVDANGRQLSDEAKHDQYGDDVSLNFAPATTGTYYLAAQGYNPGGYTIRAGTSLAPRDDHQGPVPLAVDATASGTVDSPADIDSFVVHLKAGHAYTVDMLLRTSLGDEYQPADVSLRRLDSQGNATSDATLSAYSPVLVADADGAYRIDLSTALNYTIAGYAFTVIDHGGGYASPASTGGAGNRITGGDSQSWARNGSTALDTMFCDATSADVSIRTSGKDSFEFTNASRGSADTLTGIERVIFTREKEAIALDVDKDDIGGAAYRLYQAAFDRTPDKAGVGYWMSVLEHGASLRDAAAGFVASAEFRQLYGANPTDTDFVHRLYQNVLHRAPDAAGAAYWLDALQHGSARADVLASFSESAENVAAVAQVIGDGFVFTPYGG